MTTRAMLLLRQQIFLLKNYVDLLKN